jgi:hypothetical protein
MLNEQLGMKMIMVIESFAGENTEQRRYFLNGLQVKCQCGQKRKIQRFR